jgi:fumarate reductase subunit C
VWRQALPVDPALGEYPKASEFRPARFTRLVPVAGRGAIAALVAGGLVHSAARGFHPVPVGHLAVVQSLSVLLVLRALASGCTAMTGIEAISNAVPVFKPTEWRNARITLSWMTGLLIAMFAGVLVITKLAGIVPESSQTMLSQLAHLSFGDGPAYIFVQAATAAVLLLAANTAYNDFPRVLFLMARDRQAPRSFLRIGDRLTFSTGIVLLSLTSAIVYVAFSGNTSSLLPLYAVGVFLAFTLSQTGMVVHWRHHRDQPHWRKSTVFNATGAVLSGIVFVIEGVTKFTAGAWVAIVLLGLIILAALRIRRYYDLAGQQLALRPEEAARPAAPRAPARPRVPAPQARLGRDHAGWPARLRPGDPGRSRADHRPHDRPGGQPGPGGHARAGLRRRARPAGLRPAHQPDRGRGGPVPRLLAGLGRPPAARGHRLPAPRPGRSAGQLHLDAAPAAA